MGDNSVKSFDDILSMDDGSHLTFEFGGRTFHMKPASALDHFTYRQQLNGFDANIRLIVQSLINEDGERLTKPEDEDAACAALARKNTKLINELARRAKDVNGMITPSEGPKTLVEAAKND